MADVFISYSKIDRPLVEQLAHELLAKGFTVWWDTALVSGESFRDVIVRQLKEARAVIVVWTPSSVKSEWVISEADRGRYRGVLIPVRTDDLAVQEIPPPFDVRHMDLVTNRAAIFAALARLGVSPPHDPPKPAASAPPSPNLSAESIAEALALEHWQAIKTTADPGRLRAFMSEFGATSLSRLARERLDVLEGSAWRKLPSRRDLKALRGFLAEFPDGKMASAAEAEIRALEQAAEEKAFEALLKTDDIAVVERFLAAYPNSVFAIKAAAHREMLLLYHEALASTDAETLKAFLARYPGARAGLQVRERLRSLTRKQRPPSRRWILPVAGAVSVLVAFAAGAIWLQVAGDSKTDDTAARNMDQPRSVKFPDRLAGGALQKPLPGGPRSTDVAQTIVAQPALLYEEDPKQASGARYTALAVWRTETVTRVTGLPPDILVRADIEIPDRKMTLKWTLQRNIDATLPASHTVEFMFKLPPDFAHGGVQSVPGVLVKDSEQGRGTPLAGLGVKVTDGYFLFGLSPAEADKQRNIELLKTKPWFDVTIVYADGRRAILTVDKGTPGERAFNEAFAAWKQ